MRRLGCACLAFLVLAGMRASADETPAAPLVLDYPLDGTLFPPDLAPATFTWSAPETADASWSIAIDFADGDAPLRFTSVTPHWQPDPRTWETIKRRSLARTARLTVRDDVRQRQAQVTFSTSTDPVGAPIFYREVNLPFIDAVKDPSTIRWRFGSVSASTPPPIVLDKLPVCGNCHAFSADGSVLGMDVDYANDKGSYALTPFRAQTVLDRAHIITWSDFRRDDGDLTFGLLSAVSPDGRYVVSTVKDRSVFVPKPDLTYSQLFFPIRGILAVYDRETKTFAALPGADDSDYVQSNATWSPDGKYIVFARAPAYRLRRDKGGVLLTHEECAEFLDEGKSFVYDLYRVPFNAGRGGKPEPLAGASGDGRSNFFARYSPDGRWIVFCKARSYMLLQPDSELHIIPAAGGPPRRLACNTSRMNSWHSWSPNGKWLVFSSKLNGPYTQLLLTHVDDAGRTTPPVLLERFTAPDRAANIPEFVNVPADATRVVLERFVDASHYVRAGDAHLAADGDVDGAIGAYRRALELNPNSVEAHSNLGGLLLARGDPAGFEHAHAALRLDPDCGSAHYNLGMAWHRAGRDDRALPHLAAAVRLKPDVADAQRVYGVLLCARGMLMEGVPHLTRAIELAPEDPAARYCLAQAMISQHMLDRAREPLLAAIRLKPDYAEAHHALGQLHYRRGRLADAVASLGRAAELAPENVTMLTDLAWVLATAPDSQVRDGDRAVALARQALAAGGADRYQVHDTLAAALAARGDFAAAVAAADEALRLAQASQPSEVLEQIQARIQRYRQRQPFFQQPSAH
jgi:tetratricopeptide (TPR) repeat protein